MFFLISLHFAENLASVKSDFGEQFDQHLKQPITEFANVTEEPQGLPRHRGHLDRKVKLTGYPPRQQRIRLSVPEYEELKRQYTELFKRAKLEFRKFHMLLRLLWLESHMVQFEFVLIIARLMNAR